MQETLVRKRARDVAIMAVVGLIASAVAILNLGGAPTQAAPEECREEGGGSPSPSGTATGTGTGSPSPSPSGSGGIIPSGLPLPTQSTATPSETGTGSPTPSQSSPASGMPEARCDSEISIRFVERFSRDDPRNAFTGRVRSADSLCEDERKVFLQRKTEEGSKTVGRTATNEQGRWRVFKKDPKGRYFARTPQVRRPSDHGDHICEAAKSRTIRP